MKEFSGRDAFVAVDRWLNKSLAFRDIEVRFEEPYKPSADYIIPIMATWHYQISDVLAHFLPWLEFEHYEEPETYAEEIERHLFAVWLPEPAKAFLALEAFFASQNRQKPRG
jgi:hypothetical protein